MIRFSAVLVVVAIGVLIGGIATSKLLLVYVAIGLSAAALVALAIGVVLKREELFSEQGQALAPAAAGAGADEPLLAGKPSTLPNGLVDPPDTSPPAGAVAAFGQAARGAERSGQDRAGNPAFGERGPGQAAPPATQAPPGGDWSGRMARPASPRRERPSPAYGDVTGPRTPAPPAGSSLAGSPPVGSPPAAPGWPSSPSWFDRPRPPASPDRPNSPASPDRPRPPAGPDRQKAPAGPGLSDADEDVTAGGAPSEDVMPEDILPAANAPEATVPKATVPKATVPKATVPTATVPEAGTMPGADAAHSGPPAMAEPGPGADAATDGADAEKAGATDAGSSEGSPKQVKVVQGVPRYHKEDCILIRFMADDDAQKMTVRQATEAGCTPCRACHPDTEAT